MILFNILIFLFLCSQANNAQLLIWKPREGESMIVVNPKHHDASTKKYLHLLNR
jgi:hypothetical protein